MTRSSEADLSGKRILITGAARGVGAALAQRLHARGARVALIGLESELLSDVAASCGDAPRAECNVAVRTQVEESVEAMVGRLGGLDVVVANAGVAAQLPLIGGDPTVMERTLEVNVLGTYHTCGRRGRTSAIPGVTLWPSPRSPLRCTPRCWVPTARRRRRSRPWATPCASSYVTQGRRLAWRTSPSWTPT